MHTAAEDFEAHGQIVGSNRRLLLARLGGGKKRSGLGGHRPRPKCLEITSGICGAIRPDGIKAE